MVVEQVPMQQGCTARGAVVFRAEEPGAGTVAPLKSWGAGWGADWARLIPSHLKLGGSDETVPGRAHSAQGVGCRVHLLLL